MRRFKLDIPDVGSMTVTQTTEIDNELRRIYSYVIRDSEGDLLERGRDLRSGVYRDPQDSPPPKEMTRTLLSILVLGPDSFNDRTDEWARQNRDELIMAGVELDLEEGGH